MAFGKVCVCVCVVVGGWVGGCGFFCSFDGLLSCRVCVDVGQMLCCFSFSSFCGWCSGAIYVLFCKFNVWEVVMVSWRGVILFE